MPAPTPEQKAKEIAVLTTALADLGIGLLMIGFAVATLSMSLISEAIRGSLLLVVEFYALVMLRAVHRDRLRKFRFGVGKVEQICNLVIGLVLLASGLWVADRVVLMLFSSQVAGTPLGLAAAAVVNAINTLINTLGWFAMMSAARNDDSVIYKAQLRSRLVKLASSLVVLVTLTIAALAKDPVISIWLDGLGAGIVACIMVAIGFRMVAECWLDLLDHSVPEHLKDYIAAGLEAAGVSPGELVRTRTRRSGSLPQVELTLAPAGYASLADFKRRAAEIQQTMEGHVRDADVSVVVATAAR